MTAPGPLTLFVNGTLMRGGELHANLRGAGFRGERRTAPRYRLYSIADRYPAMRRDETRGAAVVGELYEVSLPVLKRVLDGEPTGLGVGVVELDDETLTLGIVWVDGPLPREAKEITAHEDWRAYLRATHAVSARAAQHRERAPRRSGRRGEHRPDGGDEA